MRQRPVSTARGKPPTPWTAGSPWTAKRHLASGDLRRRGASIILVLAMLTTFALMAAITIDYAYMGLVQSEIRIATDAAAKAGAEALARTEQVTEAKLAAISYAELNRVAGQPLRIRDSDVHVGRLDWSQDGSWEFQENRSPANAVRVQSQTGGTSLHPAIPLFFGTLLGRETFTPHHTSTAGQQDIAVCLCLDRSGSMLFDMSGSDYSYPPSNPLLSSFTAWGAVWRNHLSPPNSNGSRWSVLEDAVQLFLDQAGTASPPPRTALVTWASDYTMPIAPATAFLAATTDVAVPRHLHADWTANRAHITNAVRQLGRHPMMGGTNLSAGLDEAVAALTAPSAGVLADKVIILMTDGQWNAGRDPIAAAIDARNAGIVVHTVTMLTGDQPVVREIATLTGGRHFSTSNAVELQQAFQELAKSLHSVLVQ